MRHFPASRGSYSRKNADSELLQKQKCKLKFALAAVSDPAVCVSLAWRQVPVYTCWPNQNT